MKKKIIFLNNFACRSLSLLLFVCFIGIAAKAVGQVIDPPPLAPPSLSTAPVPGPTPEDINLYIIDEAKAIQLGKAFFWDMQAGSDGQSCGSCHFHAGADNRIKNQLSPGLNRVPNPDTTFQSAASGGIGGPNYTLNANDFPFHKLSNPEDRNSAINSSSNDVTSSQGTFGGTFHGLPDNTELDDICDGSPDPIFHVGGVGVRKVEPRNTPTNINSVFFFRNFWDGRANNIFNGVDPFGPRNISAATIKFDANQTNQQVTATMSPGPGWGHVATRVLDGNIGTYAQSGSRIWDLTIDMGSPHSITQVNFHPHQDSWATVYDVLVSRDNSTGPLLDSKPVAKQAF